MQYTCVREKKNDSKATLAALAHLTTTRSRALVSLQLCTRVHEPHEVQGVPKKSGGWRLCTPTEGYTAPLLERTARGF
eukprot:scaffold1443_cov116-Isochrysis_galbana.AAC.2